MQQVVAEFNDAIGAVRGNTPGIRDANLRAELIIEEALEFSNAVKDNDLVAAVDAIADVLYVAFGAADAFGIDIEPIFYEVHRTNMEKTEGPVRADGKRLKPPGWQPPRIAEFIEAQRKEKGAT